MLEAVPQAEIFGRMVGRDAANVTGEEDEARGLRGGKVVDAEEADGLLLEGLAVAGARRSRATLSSMDGTIPAWIVVATTYHSEKRSRGRHDEEPWMTETAAEQRCGRGRGGGFVSFMFFLGVMPPTPPPSTSQKPHIPRGRVGVAPTHCLTLLTFFFSTSNESTNSPVPHAALEDKPVHTFRVSLLISLAWQKKRRWAALQEADACGGAVRAALGRSSPW